MSDGAAKFWSGLLVGGAIGATAGLLLAPRSGREMRRKLLKSRLGGALQARADQLSGKLGQQLSEIGENAQRTLDQTSERVQEAIQAGQEASRKLSQELNVANSTELET